MQFNARIDFEFTEKDDKIKQRCKIKIKKFNYIHRHLI